MRPLPGGASGQKGDHMQFLTISKRLDGEGSETDLALLAEAEFDSGRTLYSQNFIRQIWHRADIPGACLLVEADSEQQVRDTLSTLPLFQAGLLEISVIPLKPYAGFGPRCAEQSAEADEDGRPHVNSRMSLSSRR
jgi:muconolactone delta-isomerase